jgi:hypothetical protein
MKASTLIVGLVVGLFVLALGAFFASVILLLHGALAAGSRAEIAGVAYTVLGGAAAVALGLIIAADAIAERRAGETGSAPILTRVIRAASAWPVGMLAAACTALTGEWAMLGVSGLALVVMALQFPRRASIS